MFFNGWEKVLYSFVWSCFFLWCLFLVWRVFWTLLEVLKFEMCIVVQICSSIFYILDPGRTTGNFGNCEHYIVIGWNNQIWKSWILRYTQHDHFSGPNGTPNDVSQLLIFWSCERCICNSPQVYQLCTLNWTSCESFTSIYMKRFLFYIISTCFFLNLCSVSGREGEHFHLQIFISGVGSTMARCRDSCLSRPLVLSPLPITMSPRAW